MSANTQELGKDKWLCLLSGKKFMVSVCVCIDVGYTMVAQVTRVRSTLRC